MDLNKLYFANKESLCTTLADHLHDAQLEGLSEITLIEAIKDDGTSGQTWCAYKGYAVDNCDCKKSACGYYSSKSGRGRCEHKGTLYSFGNKEVFQVPILEEIAA